MAFSYTVPGLIVPVRTTWADLWPALFTMMYSWKNQVSIPIEAAVATLGADYLYHFQHPTFPTKVGGFAKSRLAAAAGMAVEPLVNRSIQVWLRLLMTHGPIWTIFRRAMTMRGKLGSSAGPELFVYGIAGDGTPSGTHIKYIDPHLGRFDTMRADDMTLELGTDLTLVPHVLVWPV